MLSNKNAFLALAGCILLCAPHPAQAYRGIMEDWQAYYDVCAPLVTADCTACHQNGFDFNPYGDDMKTRINDLEMTNNEAFIDLENVDSDGDDYTNGQEIVIDCTLPGEASSHGTVAAGEAAWGTIKALYR